MVDHNVVKKRKMVEMDGREEEEDPNGRGLCRRYNLSNSGK